MSYSKKYTYNNPPIVYINDEMFLNISIYLYIYTHIYSVYLQNQAHKYCSPSLALLRQYQGPDFKVLKTGTKVTAEDKELV